MIYKDRKFLSILSLAEDRDYVTYDELISLLTECPSDTVYIERNGLLCGLITRGRIMRRHNWITRRILFNKKFAFVYLEERFRAQQIFKSRGNINALPVVSEDGRLLGEYVRWNDFIGIDYAEFLYRDPHVLQILKADAKNIFFVEPTACGGSVSKIQFFLQWRRKLESESVHFQVIQRWEIKDYFSIAKCFIFVDEDEKCGNEVLNQCLYRDKKEKRVHFLTITDYLYLTSRAASAHLNTSILKALQNQNIFVLLFDFVENSNHFLARLDEKINKRNEEYGVYPASPSVWLPGELKESFFDELFCEVYKTQDFPLKMSFHKKMGIPCLSDTETELLHIQNGERLTVNQPKHYDRCIYLYGPCVVEGAFVSDQYTISSLLQCEINQAGFSCKVVNRGFPGQHLSAEQLQTESFKQGDIIILDHFGSLAEDFPVLNLINALEKHDAPADWFIDEPRHCNHKANQVYAHAIYEELIPVLQQPSEGRSPVQLDLDYIDLFYLRHYFSDFDTTNYGTIGSIIMNCNPFTLGHRFLIEEALKTVDFLIIFVVEEDESLFSFQERFAMVCQGTTDLERVMVVPSGPYILSKNTFPEYFQKIDDEDLKKNTEDDITLFAEKIAPKLGITYRFVGEEREDKVTNEYNEAMKRILPHYGIQVVEIPRKTNGPSVISASRVRACLSMNHMEELDQLIPASTKRILFYEYK